MSALITVEELQALIRETIMARPLSFETISVPVAEAVGCVLAQDIYAPVAIPNADVSAMDGYALLSDLPAQTTLTVIGESVAGQSFQGEVQAGQAVRIMTGAHVPPACTTVIIQEHVLREGDQIVLQQAAKPHANIRYLAEVLAVGDLVLSQSKVLTVADVLLLASLGFAHVSVKRKLRVAVFSTGSELQEPGTPLASSDMIFDSNRHMLMAKLATLPVEIIDCGHAKDSLEGIIEMLDQAASKADVVITSGGASVGDYDFICEAVSRIGTIHHYKVAMKPGKPFVFGSLGQSWYFGLPGNPVSGFAGFEVFIRQALACIAAGDQALPSLRFQAYLTHDVQKAPGRKEYQRAWIYQDEQAKWHVRILSGQDSHHILGASKANSFAVLPADGASLKAGDLILVQPFKDCFV